MERLLTRMMERGWITEFALLPSGLIHVRWDQSGMAVAWAFSRAMVLLHDTGSDPRDLLRDWILSRAEGGEMLEELRPFLLREFLQLEDMAEGETWNTFLDLCCRDAPWDLE